VLDYQIIDCDNHYYEPDDCFTRHLEAKFRPDRAIHVRRDHPDGIGRVFFGDERLSWMKSSPADITGEPGSLQDYLRGKVSRGSLVDHQISAHDHPAFMRREPRLELMGRQGIQTSVLLPTLGVVVEHDMRHDPEALYANFRAFNRWVEEEWSYGDDGRIIGVPMLSLVDLDLALTELERVLNRGARLVYLRPGPLYGRSPGHPVYDPFWARCAEAGTIVCFHQGQSGLHEFYTAVWGEQPNPPGIFASPLQNVICTAQRAAHDTLAAVVLHGVFNRHPTLRVASIENGSDWVPGLLHDMDKAVGMNRNDWAGGVPSEIFREHIWVSPYHEEDPRAIVDAIGVDHVLFGSDYPHPEGLAEPLAYVDDLATFSDADVRRIMRDNAARLLGISELASTAH